MVKPFLLPTTCDKGKVPLRAHPPLVQGSCQNLFRFQGVKMSQASDSEPSCRVWTQGKVAAMVAFNTPAETHLGPPVSNGTASIGQVDSYPTPLAGVSVNTKANRAVSIQERQDGSLVQHLERLSGRRWCKLLSLPLSLFLAYVNTAQFGKVSG